MGGYYIIPSKYRYLWLLGVSYYFYMQWNPQYVLLLFFSTVVTYIGGLLLNKIHEVRERKICLYFIIFVNLAVLGYFKYANMLIEYLNKIMALVGKKEIPWENLIILPVGISFFTLQAIGYLIDVYREEIYAERNFFRYALFIAFFPQLVAGPIERSKNLLKQLAMPGRFSYENLRRGLLIMLYGFFLKVVIADRIAVFVDMVFDKPDKYQGVYIVIATVLFSIQIYCDFYGYSTIARGTALTMGIKLMDNFNAPYYSKSIKEFWRRWHISLSTWFRDYLYIPLGGNRNGIIRKYVNLMVVFAISGLWHGASLAFVVWGGLHGIYQILEFFISGICCKVRRIFDLGETGVTFSDRVLKVILTFVMVCFAWLLFRAGNLPLLRIILKGKISHGDWLVLLDGSLFDMEITREYCNVVIIAIMILGIVDYQKYMGKDVIEAFFNQHWWFRTISIIGLLLYIILFGCYGTEYDTQNFIYFQF